MVTLWGYREAAEQAAERAVRQSVGNAADKQRDEQVDEQTVDGQNERIVKPMSDQPSEPTSDPTRASQSHIGRTRKIIGINHARLNSGPIYMSEKTFNIPCIPIDRQVSASPLML